MKLQSYNSHASLKWWMEDEDLERGARNNPTISSNSKDHSLAGKRTTADNRQQSRDGYRVQGENGDL